MLTQCVREMLARTCPASFHNAAYLAIDRGATWDEIANYAAALEEWIVIYEGADDDAIVRARAEYFLRDMAGTLNERVDVANAAHRIGDHNLERQMIRTVEDSVEGFESWLFAYETADSGSLLNAHAFQHLLEMNLEPLQWVEMIRSTPWQSKRRRAIVQRFAQGFPNQQKCRTMRDALGPYSRLAGVISAPRQMSLKMPGRPEIRVPHPAVFRGKDRSLRHSGD